MAIERISSPRPKILTRITFAATKTLTFNVSVAGSLDTPATAVIPAGSYYMRGDGQADDLLQVLAALMNASIDTALGSPGTSDVGLYSNPTSHKIIFDFIGAYYVGATVRDVEIDWTATDGVELAAIFGYDSATSSSSTGVDNPTFTGDHQHAYGWFTEDDGYIKRDMVHDSHVDNVLVSTAPNGRVKQIHVGTVRKNLLSLQQLPPGITHSNGTEYGSAPPYPLTRNAGLECWYLKARLGTPFCVYRNGYVDTSRAIARGVADVSASATILTDTAHAWTVDQFKGKLLYIPSHGSLTHATYYIESNTATTITITDDAGDLGTVFSNETYYVLDNFYTEYVLDTAKLSTWDPDEATKGVDIYDISLPFLRYVA